MQRASEIGRGGARTGRRARRSDSAETQAIAATFDRAPVLERVTLLPKRGQVSVQLVALGWDPD